jgi:hypothetical protein
MEQAPQGNETQIQAPPSEPAGRDDSFAAKFAAIQRREREIVQREKAAKERDPEWESYQKLKTRAKHNPEEWLKHAGLTYDEVTEFYLNGGSPKVPMEVLEMQEKMSKWEKEREEERLQSQEKQKHAAVEAFKSKIEAACLRLGDEVELVNKLPNGIDRVYAKMDEHFTKTQEATGKGEQLDIAEAARMLEAELEADLAKYKDIGKLKRLFGARAEEPGQPRSEQEARSLAEQIISNAGETPKPKPATTLTNQMSQVPGTDRPLNDEERRQKAASILRFMGE